MDQIDGDVVEATFHTLAAGEISSHKTGGYRHHDVKCDDQECLHPYPSLSGDLQYEELRYELCRNGRQRAGATMCSLTSC